MLAQMNFFIVHFSFTNDTIMKRLPLRQTVIYHKESLSEGWGGKGGGGWWGEVWKVAVL